MAGTLAVWKFPTATGAQTAVETLKDLQKQELITVHDGAVVSWEEGAKSPRHINFESSPV